MGIRDKHLRAKQEKKELKKEIENLKTKIKKRQRKIDKKEAKIDSLNTKIKEFKKELRERKTKEKKSLETRKKLAVKKEKALVPETEKKLSKIKKTKKSLVPTSDKSLRKLEEKEKQPTLFKSEKDDLTLIEGIGEKTEVLLNEKGIRNYLQLANCSSDALDEIIKGSFSNYRVFNTLTWPEQAILAHNGQWEELKKLQLKLVGGE